MTGTIAYLLYAVFAIGAAGVGFALPRAGRSTRLAGNVIGLAAVALLIVVLATYGAGQEFPTFTYIFSAVALLAGGRVVTHPKPVYSALYFILVVVAIAFLLVLQKAEFLAVALIIIYAGAILVTYAFVIMLAQQSGAASYDTRSREPFWAVLAGFVTMAAVVGQIERLPTGAAPQVDGPVRYALAADEQAPPEPQTGNTMAIGEAMLTRYVITLEIAGVLLLVAMIGAISIARKRIPAEETGGEETPLGQIGRQVPPF
ncbi:MAG: hypothetical protein GY778_08985 [bacterium]|nr:hypothetical protein [bacterium]